MADPNDYAEIGAHVGSGLGGAGAVGFLIKMLLGSGMADLKERIVELKADVKEQMSGVKEMIERSERRHDATLEQVALAKSSSAALHQRFDVLEMRITALERGGK